MVGRVSPTDPVPPSKRGRVVALKGHVVVVMEVGPRPKRKEIVQAPRKVIARVGVHDLEQADREPHDHRDDMELVKGDPDQRPEKESEAQDERLQGMGVLGSESKRRRVLMVQFVNLFVENAPVEEPMGKVLVKVFHEQKEERGLSHREPGHGWR